MKENIMATDFEPHEGVILVQSKKIGTHENKAINNIENYSSYRVITKVNTLCMNIW